MRIFRPALLVLLASALAGLGVPASFGQVHAPQSKTGNGKTTVSGSASKSHHSSPIASKNPSAKSASKTSGKSAAKSSGKTTSGKISSKRSRKQTGQKAPTGDRISEIQLALAREGSYQGSPSGKWDDDTAAAMRKFQASHGLSPNGKLDAPSLQRLGLGSQTAGIAPPTPPPGSTSRLTSSNNTPSGSTDSPRHP